MVDALVSGTSGSDALEVRVFLSAPSFGVVAQLIERYVRIVEVVGLSPISSTRKIQTPFIGVLIFSERDENTRGVGLYRRKKADGSMPVCVSKFCKVGEANPISSTRNKNHPYGWFFCGKSGPAGTYLPLPRHFVPPLRLAKGIDLCFRPFILVFLYQILYNSQCNGGLPLWGIETPHRVIRRDVKNSNRWVGGP